MTAPNASAQHRELPLAVTTGPHGYRLAFAGGYEFEVLADGLTLDAAYALHKLAKEATNALIFATRTVRP